MPAIDTGSATRPDTGLRRRCSDSAAAKTASVALVLVGPGQQPGAASHSRSRPDPTFVTHLIAMAEQSPQTRQLRRAAIADVEAAYRATADQNRPLAAPGERIRHSA